jgi:protein-L-isoaspartate(D-aspartate) O-methyltransferase
MQKQMIEQQIIHRGIRDERVIEAMLKVPRHEFVPPELSASAYEDNPLPIGAEQTISQPFIVAFMTAALKLKKTDRVLEIGTGSGYQTAVLAEIAGHVYTVEIIEELAVKAAQRLRRLGCENITAKTGDGSLGWPEHAPYNAIIVTAAAAEIPGPLLDQLAEHGRMVMPVGDVSQELVLAEKNGNKISRKNLLSVRFVEMTGRAGYRGT